MLVFIVPGLFPGGETIREGPAIDCEADTAKDRKAGVLRAPESGGKRVQVAKWGGRRSLSGCGDVRGWGKVSSRGEQRVRQGVI